ncbi:MAG: hypothetical protein ACLFTM_07720, partial [Ectothiorhodospira sp.]
MDLPDGLYDRLLTESLRDALARVADERSHTLKGLSAEDASERLIEAISFQLGRILDDLKGDGQEK